MKDRLSTDKQLRTTTITTKNREHRQNDRYSTKDDSEMPNFYDA